MELRVPTEVVLVVPPGGDTETTQNHVMVCAFYGVPEGDILEQTAVCPDNLVHPGPHHPPQLEHAPHPAVPLP